MNADDWVSTTSPPVSASAVSGVIYQYELRTAVSLCVSSIALICERILRITLMSPKGEKYLEQARAKSRNRVSSLPCLPSRTFRLKDQYFNMLGNPALCKEETADRV